MNEKVISLKSTVIERPSFQKVVNTSITSFIDQVTTLEQISVEEFFTEYERLYFDIPASGDTQSHEYLIKRSKELFEEDNLQDIQPLLDEIASLREQILELTAQSLESSNT